MEIEKIPTDELLKDKEDSLTDIEVCKKALLVGITEHKGMLTQTRLEINQKIVDKINSELERRK